MTAFTHDAYFTKTLADADPDVFKGIQGELGRQREQIELFRAAYKEAGHTRTPRVKLTPYIEAQQVVFAELQPGNDVVTYSIIAAGVDAAIRGRNNEGSVSVRYERRFGWGDNAQDSDAISGVARFSSAVKFGRSTSSARFGAVAEKTRA